MSKFPKAEIYAEVGKFLDCFIAERQPELRETYNISDEMLEEIHESIDWIEDKSELQLFPPACVWKKRGTANTIWMWILATMVLFISLNAIYGGRENRATLFLLPVTI